MLKTLLAKPANHVAPVPDEVLDAAAEELKEPWEETLNTFVHEQMEPTDKPAFANTAAEVRDAFFKAACGSVQSRDVRLKLARKGFHETTQAVKDVVNKSTKRVYQYSFGVHGVSFVRLRGCDG